MTTNQWNAGEQWFREFKLIVYKQRRSEEFWVCYEDVCELIKQHEELQRELESVTDTAKTLLAAGSLVVKERDQLREAKGWPAVFWKGLFGGGLFAEGGIVPPGEESWKRQHGSSCVNGGPENERATS